MIQACAATGCGADAGMHQLSAQISEAAVGSPVTLWGEGLSADEVAASAGTVSYELLCALSPRVPVTG